jgi:branched-chain amino acid transport system substrate-binding protein
MFPTGASEADLKSPASHADMQDVTYFDNFVPTQLNTPATRAMQANLKKYQGITTPADYYLEEGYMEGSLLTEALQVAGPNPTRQAVIRKLRKVTNFTAAGLNIKPVSYAGGPDAFGLGPNNGAGSGECAYFVRGKGNVFVPVQKTPTCGSIIPGS